MMMVHEITLPSDVAVLLCLSMLHHVHAITELPKDAILRIYSL